MDASIKHARMDCFCGLFVCVCVISFFFNQFLSSSLVWPSALFGVGGLCVRY